MFTLSYPVEFTPHYTAVTASLTGGLLSAHPGLKAARQVISTIGHAGNNQREVGLKFIFVYFDLLFGNLYL